MSISPRAERYRLGMVYTPASIVTAMVDWVLQHRPVRAVDMGCGSGRFAVAIARRAPEVQLVAVDIDPVATLITRARLAAIGARHARVIQGDYLDLELESVDGPTAFIGNPPYVRHHKLDVVSKAKATAMAERLGLCLSGLAGLHVHFLVATAIKARPLDIGCVITSAEWMQVGYGRVLRDLLVHRLGLEVLHLLVPEAMAFPGIQTTSVILGFRVGSRTPHVLFTPHTRPETLGQRNGHSALIPRELLRGERWSSLRLVGGASNKATADGSIPLGAFARVHRGVATGANAFFVMTDREVSDRGLGPWVRPVLTEAEQVLNSPGLVRRGVGTRFLLCPPADADLEAPESEPLKAYLRWGERQGIHQRYLCAHRRPWWYLGRLQIPPIVATYMARRPPAFALNPEGLLILNVFHGIYLARPVGWKWMASLVDYLNAHRTVLRGQGRMYQGGLEKFEPRELEAVRIPRALYEAMAVDG